MIKLTKYWLIKSFDNSQLWQAHNLTVCINKGFYKFIKEYY